MSTDTEPVTLPSGVAARFVGTRMPRTEAAMRTLWPARSASVASSVELSSNSRSTMISVGDSRSR